MDIDCLFGGRYGFDRDRSSLSSEPRRRLVKRHQLIITGKQNDFAVAA